MNKQLFDYVAMQLNNDVPEKEITKVLIKKGWDEKEIHHAVDDARHQILTKKLNNLTIQLNTKAPSANPARKAGFGLLFCSVVILFFSILLRDATGVPFMLLGIATSCVCFILAILFISVGRFDTVIEQVMGALRKRRRFSGDKCPKCGAKIGSEDDFCAECGTDI